MQATTSGSSYEARIQRVLSYIEKSPDEPLNLQKLSEIANFSPFHFHRLFIASIGQTVGEYVRQRRLEIGAERLLDRRRLTVVQVALEVGFSSPEAFARAFRSRFKCSPRDWRAQHRRRSGGKPSTQRRKSKFSQVGTGLIGDHTDSSGYLSRHFMEIKVIEREPVTVAFLRHTGPYGEGVGQFFRTVFYPWLAASQLLDRDCYGISHDDPRTTDPARCRYDTCVVVADDFIPQGGASMTVIPGGRYAVMHYQGRSADIGAAWAAIFNDWLPGSGYAVDARPCFEYYPREVPAHGELGEFYCDICVPVIEQRG